MHIKSFTAWLPLVGAQLGNYFSSDGWRMFYRVFAAIVGGFALTITSSMLLSQVLDMLLTTRANATITAMLLSFAIYTAIVMWFFSIDTVKRVWINLLIGLTTTGGLVLMIKYWSL